MDRKVGEERKPHEEYVEYLADNQWQDERPLVSRSVAVALDLVIVQGMRRRGQPRLVGSVASMSGSFT
jgi:hypothetical protein